jgi:rhodanese-related sulfurtransferase
MMHMLNPNELHNMIESGEDLVIVDCREVEEYNNGHIRGAILIPLSRFNEDRIILKNKEAKIVCYCRGGARSLSACQLLNDQGFEELYSLQGGMLAWQDSFLPIEVPNIG